MEGSSIAGPQVGGRRWWWVCPQRGDLVSKIYKPNSRGRFASRKAHGIAYHSQRESPCDRAITQAFKRRRRLGSTGGIGSYVEKPKGMRWATFHREMKSLEQVEGVVDAHAEMLIRRLTKSSS